MAEGKVDRQLPRLMAASLALIQRCCDCSHQVSTGLRVVAV